MKNVAATKNMTHPARKHRPSRASAAADSSNTVHAGSPLLNGTGSGNTRNRPDNVMSTPASRR